MHRLHKLVNSLKKSKLAGILPPLPPSSLQTITNLLGL